MDRPVRWLGGLVRRQPSRARASSACVLRTEERRSTTDMSDASKIVKLILLGDPECGKTSLLLRYCVRIG